MLYHLIIDENSNKNSVKVYEEDQIIAVKAPSLQEAIDTLGSMDGAQNPPKKKYFFTGKKGRQIDGKAIATAKDLYLFHKRHNYKDCFPRIFSGGSAAAAEDALKMHYDVTEEGLKEGQAAMLCFNLWQDIEMMGNIESADRHKEAYKAFYGQSITNYNYFRGFVGGLDFFRFTQALQK